MMVAGLDNFVRTIVRSIGIIMNFYNIYPYKVVQNVRYHFF